MALFDTFKNIGGRILSGAQQFAQDPRGFTSSTFGKLEKDLNLGKGGLASVVTGGGPGSTFGVSPTGIVTGKGFASTPSGRAGGPETFLFKGKTSGILSPSGVRQSTPPPLPPTLDTNTIGTGASSRERRAALQRALGEPETATGGVSSFGGVQTTTPPVTAEGGRSAFTGLLGAAGGIGTPATVDGELDEDDPRVQAILAGGGRIDPDLQRQRIARILGLETGPRITEEPTFAATTPSPVVDAAQLTGAPTQQDVFAQRNTIEGILADEPQEIVDRVVELLVAQQARMAGVTEPALDTEEQQAAIDAILNPADRRNFVQELDDFKRNLETGFVDDGGGRLTLPQLENRIIETEQLLHSTTQVFQQIVDDIKSNRDLPKGLARRRIEDFNEKNKVAIQNLQGTLEIMFQARDFANDRVNEFFKLTQFEIDEEERDRKRKLDIYELMVTSGAVGALTEAEMQEFADQLGIPTSVIRKQKESANNPDLDIRQKVDKKGNLVGIDNATGDVIWKVPGFSQPEGAGAGATLNVEGFRISRNSVQNISARTGISVPDLQSLPGAELNMFTSGEFERLADLATGDLEDFISEPEEIISEMSSDPGLAQYPTLQNALVNHVAKETQRLDITPTQAAIEEQTQEIEEGGGDRSSFSLISPLVSSAFSIGGIPISSFFKKK